MESLGRNHSSPRTRLRWCSPEAERRARRAQAGRLGSLLMGRRVRDAMDTLRDGRLRSGPGSQSADDSTPSVPSLARPPLPPTNQRQLPTTRRNNAALEVDALQEHDADPSPNLPGPTDPSSNDLQELRHGVQRPGDHQAVRR